jgi:hypothetical protein
MSLLDGQCEAAPCIDSFSEPTTPTQGWMLSNGDRPHHGELEAVIQHLQSELSQTLLELEETRRALRRAEHEISTLKAKEKHFTPPNSPSVVLGESPGRSTCSPCGLRKVLSPLKYYHSFFHHYYFIHDLLLTSRSPPLCGIPVLPMFLAPLSPLPTMTPRPPATSFRASGRRQ